MTKEDVPEFFIRGDAKRTVAGWELLATLVAVSLFVPSGYSLGRCVCAVPRGDLRNCLTPLVCF